MPFICSMVNMFIPYKTYFFNVNTEKADIDIIKGGIIKLWIFWKRQDSMKI